MLTRLERTVSFDSLARQRVTIRTPWAAKMIMRPTSVRMIRCVTKWCNPAIRPQFRLFTRPDLLPDVCGCFEEHNLTSGVAKNLHCPIRTEFLRLLPTSPRITFINAELEPRNS